MTAGGDVSLIGRVALVTDGKSGIGRAISLGLADAGAAVGVFARNKEMLEEVRAEIVRRGGQAEVVSGDVTVENAVRKAIEHISYTLGPIDLLVNNAAAQTSARSTRRRGGTTCASTSWALPVHAVRPAADDRAAARLHRQRRQQRVLAAVPACVELQQLQGRARQMHDDLQALREIVRRDPSSDVGRLRIVRPTALQRQRHRGHVSPTRAAFATA
jgi:NAD(P)-dependent dehydrogenase (short-subunit alcohol dehydrogenase family)